MEATQDPDLMPAPPLELDLMPAAPSAQTTASPKAALQQTKFEEIKDRPLLPVLVEFLVDSAFRDPQAMGYEESFGKYYKKQLMIFLHKKVPASTATKKFCDLSMEDFRLVIGILNQATEERLRTARRANAMMLFLNSINLLTYFLLDYMAFAGIDNGGCGGETEGELASSFAQQPLPAVAVSSVGLLANLILAFQQDANNHFTEIVQNFIIKSLKTLINKNSITTPETLALIDRLDMREKASLEEILSKIDEQHHRQHFHETLRFRVRAVTIVCFMLRAFISLDKITALISSSFDASAFCDSQGMTPDEYAALGIQGTNLIMMIQSAIRTRSNDGRDDAFKKQNSCINAILRLMKDRFTNEDLRYLLVDMFLVNPIKPDSHDHSSHGHGHGRAHYHGHGHGESHSFWHRARIHPEVAMPSVINIEMSADAEDVQQDQEPSAPSKLKIALRRVYGGTLYAVHKAFAICTGDRSDREYQEIMKLYQLFELESTEELRYQLAALKRPEEELHSSEAGVLVLSSQSIAESKARTLDRRGLVAESFL